MEKLVIYGDCLRDFVKHYSLLATGHEAHIRYVGSEHTRGYKELGEYVRELEEVGFDPNNFVEGVGEPESEDADIYFVCRMMGRGYDIAARLPREKVFIYSTTGNNYEIVIMGYKDGADLLVPLMAEGSKRSQ